MLEPEDDYKNKSALEKLFSNDNCTVQAIDNVFTIYTYKYVCILILKNLN